MVRLSTLGTSDLRLDDGGSADAILRQPRRFALLVYLALESRRGFVRRDRVLAVFWPDAAQAAARSSLSQALHHFRVHLGREIIELRGQEDLRLAPSAIWTDACALLHAVESGEGEEALRLARGEFLPGFFAGGLREFEDWADGLRAELRRAVSEAGWAAAEAAAARGEPVAAGVHARQAAAACPDDEAALRRLMQLLARIGDGAGALAAYDAFAERLRREYEAEPAEATRRLAEDLRNGGGPAVTEARLLRSSPEPAAVDEPGLDPVPAPNAIPALGHTPRSGRSRPISAAASVAGTVVLLLGLVSLWGLRRNTFRPPSYDRASVYIEAVPGLGGPLLTGAIAEHLRRAERVEVVLGDAGPDRRADVPSFSLRTSVIASDTVIHATALLLDPERETVIATVSFVESAAAAGTALERAGERIAGFARQAAGAELDRRRAELAAVPRSALGTWVAAERQIVLADSLISRGLHAAARIRLLAADSALDRLERTAPRNGVFARERAAAWYALSNTYDVAAPPDPARARAALAVGIRHATRALELDPSDARAREWRGALRFWWSFTAPADSENTAQPVLALAESDLAEATRQLPGPARAWALLSAIYQQAGSFEKAYVAAQNALAADAYLQQARSVRARLFATALEVNDSAGAEQACTQIRRDEARTWLAAYCALTLMAWGDVADPAAVGRASALRDDARADRLLGQVTFQIDGAYGVILAKAGRDRDARALARTLADANSDEALPEAAWISLALGDTVSARRLLARFVAASPARRSWVAKSRRFANAPASPHDPAMSQ